MKRVLIFGGTTEGRLLCEAMAGLPVDVTVCVATAYGREVLSGLPASVTIHAGRMDGPAMEALMRDGYACAVDATHPYAVAASETIRAAAARARLPYYRLSRPPGDARAAHHVATAEEAVALLRGKAGNVMITTGVKTLDAYTALDDYAARVYVRVLPTETSIARCAALGFPRGHIIAMQGPFSQALNEALIGQLDIRWLVTKDSGKAGGVIEKLDAAARRGIDAVVIGRPPEPSGQALETLLALLSSL